MNNKPYRSLTLILVLLLLAACTGPLSEAPMGDEPPLLTDADIGSAALELAGHVEALLGSEAGEVPDGPESELPEAGAEDGVTSQAVLPNAGGYLAYVRHDPTGDLPWQLWLANQASGKKTAVYGGVRAIESVAVSLDGSRLVFTMLLEAGNYEVYRSDLRAGTVSRLTRTAYAERNVSMSADARTLVWEGTSPQGRRAVFIRDYRAGGQERMLEARAAQVQPSVSSDGNLVALVRLRAGDSKIMLYDRAANSYVSVFTGGHTLMHPSSSNDGGKVAWLERRSEQGRADRVRVKTIASGALSSVVSSRDGVRHPHLTADGRFLSYGLKREGSWHVYAVDLTTGQRVRAARAPAGADLYAAFWQTYPSGTLKWRYRTGGGADASSPAVGADGTVYIGSSDGRLYAVNPDGGLRWSYATGGDLYAAPAVAADGTVYIGSSDGRLYAVSPDGSLKWRYRIGPIFSASPAIAADGTVYIGSYKGLYALRPDGRLKWRYQADHITASPAVAADGTVYTGSSDGSLYALGPDGRLKWRYQAETALTTPPAVGADGTVYVGTDEDWFYAVRPDGRLKWQFSTEGASASSPAVIGSDGTVYVAFSYGPYAGVLAAIRPNGRLSWHYGIGSALLGAPTVGADGTVYLGSSALAFSGEEDGQLNAIGPDGKLKWQYSSGGAGTMSASSPALLADGTVYIGSSDGLYAIYSDSAGLAASPWPKFQGDNKNGGQIAGRR
jgi:outer membrane protein assembly factor BamB